MADTDTEVNDVRAALADEFHAAVDDAHERITAVLDPACPSPAFLAALASELAAAAADPTSVPYPDLIDPDRYWVVAVQPQARAVCDQVAHIVEWLEARVIGTMEVAERDLKRLVEVALVERTRDPVADRATLEGTLQERCTELHHLMAELLGVLPDPSPLMAARSAHVDGMRQQAMHDVDGLKQHYLAEAGGDEEHQRFAEQQWSETYPERVSHREAMLAAAPPWRHQQLAIVGHERVLSDVEALLEASVARLQAPLEGLPRLLLERYDEGRAS